MNRTRLSSVLAAAAGGAVLLLAPSSASAAGQGTQCENDDVAVTSTNIPDLERTLLCVVNVYRAGAGAAPLTEDPSLFKAARAHSAYIESSNSPEGNLGDGTPSDRARAAGFQCEGECVFENVAFSGFPGTTPNDLFNVWKGRAGDNAKMLNGSFVTAGMGFALGPNHATTGTQSFSALSNGATDTAADLLTSPKCDDAQELTKALIKRLAKDEERLKKAKGPDHRKRAKKKVKKDEKNVKAATADERKTCDLTY